MTIRRFTSSFFQRVLVGAAWLCLPAVLLPATLAAQGNGSSVSPYTTLFEWNRTDFTQFTRIDINPTNLVETFYSTQPSTAYSVTPMVQWIYFWPGGATRYLFTNDAYAPTADEDLVIEADVALTNNGGSTNRHGVGCFDPQNPTSNFYLLMKNGSSAWELHKYVGGTMYTQATPTATSGGGGGAGAKHRVRFILTNSGGARVHLFGMPVIDVPMTLGNSTVLTSCKPGLVVNQNGWMSMIRVFRMKRDGEQLF